VCGFSFTPHLKRFTTALIRGIETLHNKSDFSVFYVPIANYSDSAFTLFENTFIGHIWAAEQISEDGQNCMFANAKTKEAFTNAFSKFRSKLSECDRENFTLCNFIDTLSDPINQCNESLSASFNDNFNHDYADNSLENIDQIMNDKHSDLSQLFFSTRSTPEYVEGSSSTTHAFTLFSRQNCAYKSPRAEAKKSYEKSILKRDSEKNSNFVSNATSVPLTVKKGKEKSNLRNDEIENSIEYCKSIGFNFEKCQLNQKQLRIACDLLVKYKSAISMGEHDIGHCKLISHKIQLKPGTQPIFIRNRPVSHYHLQPLKKVLDNLERNGVIVPSHSPWNSPIRIVQKKPIPGQKETPVRLTIDFRKLNQACFTSSYPLPKITTILDGLKKSKFFTSIDIRSAFFQLELHPDSRPMTGFGTPWGHFEFRRVPQGQSSSPQFFAQTIYQVLGDIPSVALYIDDILVYNETIEDHLVTLERVLVRLHKHNLKLSPSKTELCKSEVLYLGFIIDRNGLRTSPKKVDTIAKWPAPTSPDLVLSFLGVSGYYRFFINEYACLEKPLRALTTKKARESPFVMNDEAMSAFNRIKSALISAPVLIFPDFDKPFYVFSDACKYAVGGILSQMDPETGLERVVRYASKKFAKFTQNYTATDLECLGATFLITVSFKPYLYACPRKFYLITDHKNMTAMFTTNDSKRLFRYAMVLQPYSFDIIYRRGRNHLNCDAISRIAAEIDDGEEPLREETIFEHEGVMCVTAADLCIAHVVTRAQAQKERAQTSARNDEIENGDDNVSDSDSIPFLLNAQLEDNLLLFYRNALLSKDEIQERKVPIGYFIDIDGLLRYKGKYQSNLDKFGALYCVPDKLRTTIISSFHDLPTAGHLAYEKTLSRIVNKYYWATMRKDIKSYLSSCGTCNARNKANYKYKHPISTLPICEPFHTLQIDLLGPLQESPEGFTHIVVIIDYFSSFLVTDTVKDTKAETIARCLVNRWFYVYGIPEIVACDEASYFTGQVMEKIREIFGFDMKFVRPQNHKSLGRCERIQSTIAAMLSKMCELKADNWSDHLAAITHAYNTSVQASTKYSPYFLLFGRLPETIFDRKMQLPKRTSYSELDGYVNNLEQVINDSFQIAAQNLSDVQRRMTQNYNLHLRIREISKGDLVRYHDPSAQRDRCRTLANCWRGPMICLKVIRNHHAWLQKIDDVKAVPIARNWDSLKLCPGEKKNFSIDLLDVDKRIQILRAKFGDNVPDKFISLFSRTRMKSI